MAYLGRISLIIVNLGAAMLIGANAVRGATLALVEFGFRYIGEAAATVWRHWLPPLATVTGPLCSDYDGPPVSFTRYEAMRRTQAAARHI